MTDSNTLINKVAQSGIVTIDLENYVPKESVTEVDIKQFLFKELILKEKDFRAALKAYNWAAVKGKAVVVFCSADTIIPKWAYMLVTKHLLPFTDQLYFGKYETAIEQIIATHINGIKVVDFKDKKVVIKGCGKLDLSGNIYIQISKKLLPVVSSLMFGEPCSTVPIYKRK